MSLKKRHYDIEEKFYSKNPTQSWGVVCYTIINGEIYYLAIQRKDTIGFTDFVRGKYSSKNSLKHLLEEMTQDELQTLKTTPFNTIWNTMWCNKNSRLYKNIKTPEAKFNELDINELVNASCSRWKHQEIEFPKGRKKKRESGFSCATREFLEETTYDYFKETDIYRGRVFTEEYMGSNGVFYKHSYFITKLKPDAKRPPLHLDILKQHGEVKDVQFINYKTFMNSIRYYYPSKRNLLTKVHNFIQNNLEKKIIQPIV